MVDPGVARSTRLPVVVVAGRPNVGKSTLVNRIVGRRAAVVESESGVTRDRKALQAEWNGVPFTLIDTGGWLGRGDELTTKVSGQSERALADADVVLMVTDVTVGATDEDLETARLVKRLGPPVLLVANKVDDTNREPAAWELVSLGLGDPWPISALHGRGTGDLLDEVVRLLPARLRTDDAEPEDTSEPGTDVPRVALVGRPNAGKSTLFNRLVGEERSIVHDLPGTTRDAVDTVIETPDGKFCFIDTAGMRRPSRTDYGTEHHSVLRALDALDGADIALLIIDATVGATHQDQRLAERVGVAGCPSVVVLNKWDLVAPAERDDVLAGVGDRLAFLGDAPVIRISALSGRNVHKVLPAVQEAVVAYHTRIPTGALNRALRDLQAKHPAPRARIRYGVQGAADPPTFTLFATAKMSADYLRYVEHQIRERFDLGPTPIKLRVRIGGR
ncbi:MAG TPA: ribosome biogenesis GTPase Der [Acidimicrobiales bacterium]|nr:ribosome biogenesis GTPase Der [Acidimicrobiales bacterium]